MMLNKKTVQDIEVCNKKVLVRCDFNVPLDKVTGTKITSDKRIVESLKTIKYLINEKAKVILCSHIGSIGENKSLKSVAIRLSQLLEQDVIFANDILSNNTKKIIDNMKNGDVVLLENTRMYKEEGENDLEFAKKLAS
ncbi:MAG: phosphoglycerate kinase, partial [Clostridia bacterium]